jgi:hypothetical protein
MEASDQTVLAPAPGGGFLGREATWQIESRQLSLGGGRVLDVGVYGGTATRTRGTTRRLPTRPPTPDKTPTPGVTPSPGVTPTPGLPCS